LCSRHLLFNKRLLQIKIKLIARAAKALSFVPFLISMATVLGIILQINAGLFQKRQTS